MTSRPLTLAALGAGLVLAAALACAGAKPAAPLGPPTGPTLRELARGRIHVGTAVTLQGLGDPDYARLLAEQYDIVVAENAMKLDQLQPARGRFEFGAADALVGFAQAHGMVVRGHCLIWHNQARWLFRPTRKTDGWDTGYALVPGIAAADLPAILAEHVRTVVSHFKGKVAYWDVVNEAIADNLPPGLSVDASLRSDGWAQAYPGKTRHQYIEDAFRIAHQADPAAKLFYNEYGNEGLRGWGHKSDYTYQLVKRLLADGVPIHGVGLQMHLDASGYPLDDGFAENLKRFTDLGLEVHVTELDVRISTPPSALALERQKELYRDLLRAALANPKVTAFLTWGLDDGHSWIPQFYPGKGAGLPFDAGYGAKPAFHGMQEALGEKQ
jgi:endo-1,4-beta-xylanase